VSAALVRPLQIVTEIAAAIELAKGEVPDIALEGLVLARAESKVLRRRLENPSKAVGGDVV
jgi:hypothetical protein